MRRQPTIEFLQGVSFVLEILSCELTRKSHLIQFSIIQGGIRADDYEGELFEDIDPTEAAMISHGPYPANLDGVYDLVENITLSYIETYNKRHAL